MLAYIYWHTYYKFLPSYLLESRAIIYLPYIYRRLDKLLSIYILNHSYMYTAHIFNTVVPLGIEERVGSFNGLQDWLSLIDL